MAFNRLFLAIPVPKEVSLEITVLLAPLTDIKGVRLVPPENYHVTVHFFGNVEEERVALLIREIAGAMTGQPPFVLKVEKLALFSKRHRGMIWVKFSAAEAFDELCNKINHMLGEPAKEQTAHITCARIKPGALKEAALPTLPDIRPFEINVRQVKLLKSEDSKEGVRYSSIATFAFE